MWKTLYSIVVIFGVMSTVVRNWPAQHYYAEPGEHQTFRKSRHLFYRNRTIDLDIKVPFFTMFLKRKGDGPTRFGLRVFPEHGGLVNISHEWD